MNKKLSFYDRLFIKSYFNIGDEIILGNSVIGYNNRVIKGNTMIIKHTLNQVWFRANNCNSICKYGILDYDKKLIDILRQKTWSYNETSGCEYFKTGSYNYRLHKAVLDYYYPELRNTKKFDVDHLNNNGLDNRLRNIHYVIKSKNSYKIHIDKDINMLEDFGYFKFNMVFDHLRSKQYILTIIDFEDYNKFNFCYRNFDELSKSLHEFLNAINRNKVIDYGILTKQSTEYKLCTVVLNNV